MDKKTQAVSVTTDATKGIDLAPRRNKIIAEITSLLPIEAVGVVWESTYWGKGVGAFHVKGYWTEDGKRKPVIAKVQGAQPMVSEVEMIRLFANQNKSTLVRPPEIYGHIPWTDERGYEIIVMEEIEGTFVIEDHMPASKEQITEFFHIIDEYKTNCVTVPWLEKPKTFSYRHDFFGQLLIVRKKQYPTVELWDQDMILAEKVIDVLDATFKPELFEFMHTHLSVYDVMNYGGDVLFFSNLFWKYRWRFYDYVFGFEWYLLGLYEETEETIHQQIELWHSAMFDSEYGSKNTELLRIAILERYVAALILDSLMLGDEAGNNMRVILRKEINRLYRE